MNELRIKLIKLIEKIFELEGGGCYLRSQSLKNSNDIDLLILPEKIGSFLTSFLMGIYDQHDITAKIDFTNKEVVKIDIKSAETGCADHIDLWYYRNFILDGKAYKLKIDRIINKHYTNNFRIIEPIEAGLYLLHAIERNTLSESKISSYPSLKDLHNNASEDTTSVMAAQESMKAATIKKLVDLGILTIGRSRSERRTWYRTLPKKQLIWAFLGADGVGKTTLIKNIQSTLPHKNFRITKFKRIYHKVFLYRKIRNGLRILPLAHNIREHFDNASAINAANYSLHLMKLFGFKNRNILIDRYTIDLAIQRKSEEFSINQNLACRANACLPPNITIVLRASPEKIIERRQEMPIANIKPYYRELVASTVNNHPAYIFFVSSDNAESKAIAENICFQIR